MKAFGFWVLFSVIGIGFVRLGFSSKGTTSFSSAGMFSTHHGDHTTMTRGSRKLKEHDYNPSTSKHDTGSVELEDYHPIDPVPSSKASVRPGPIQHGTPLMPYIPKPMPPGHPKHGWLPSPPKPSP